METECDVSPDQRNGGLSTNFSETPKMNSIKESLKHEELRQNAISLPEPTSANEGGPVIISHKKAVSFSSTPQEMSRKVVDAPDCIRCMTNGTEMIKLRSGGRHYRRTYYLDMTDRFIRWYPSSKKAEKAYIPLDQVMEVRSGTTALQAYLEKSSNASGSVASAGSSAATSIMAAASFVVSPGLSLDSIQANAVLLIVHGSHFHQLCLVTSSPEEAQIWFTGISCLIHGKTVDNPLDTQEGSTMRDRWLQDSFEEARRREHCDFLNEEETVNLLHQLKPDSSIPYIRQRVREAMCQRQGNTNCITRDDFVHVYKESFTRPELYFLLVKHSTSGEYFTVDDLLLFLTAEQGMINVTREYCATLIQQYETIEEARDKEIMSIDGFTKFLQSSVCDGFNPDFNQIWQDMTQPLPHYFIAASYRTYLLEDQLKGPSSVDGYRAALQSGCRFLEIDCWDGAQREPIVYHGKTLTSQIPFEDVVETISKYAFTTTEFPLLVSLNNHCGVSQQRRIVSILQQYWTEVLFTFKDWLQWLKDSEEILNASSASQIRWPSPWELRGRILLKSKCYPSATSNGQSTETGYVTEEDEDAKEKLSDDANGAPPLMNGPMESFSKFEEEPTNTISTPSSSIDGNSLPPNNKERIMKLWKPLSDLVSIFPSYRFRENKLFISSRQTNKKPSLIEAVQFGTRRPLTKTTETAEPVDHSTGDKESNTSIQTKVEECSVQSPLQISHYGIFNIAEVPAYRLSENESDAVLQFTKRSFLRVYPSSSRVDSSNMYPLELWSCGVQLVCLNYQTPGLMMDLQRAMFARNGNCGYVLKPGHMREPSPIYSSLPDSEDVVLHIRVISGLHLPKPRASVSRSSMLEPYVVLEVFGPPTDGNGAASSYDAWSSSGVGVGGELRTRTVPCQENQRALFDDSFQFNIPFPEMTLLRFLVVDDESIGDEFIGQCTLPMQCLQTGYRHIQLKDQLGGDVTNALLFVHIAITEKSADITKPLHHGPQKKGKHHVRYPVVKKLGLATVDEIFKSAIESIREAVDLRSSLRQTLHQFRIDCGASSIANIRQCIHSLWQRVGSVMQQHNQTFPSPTSIDITNVVKINEASTSEAPSPRAIRRSQLTGRAKSMACSSVHSNTPPLWRRQLTMQRSGALRGGSVDLTNYPTDKSFATGGSMDCIPSEISTCPALKVETRQHDGLPHLLLAADVVMPDMLRQCCSSYEQLIEACKVIIQEADTLAAHLQMKYLEASQQWDLLPSLCDECGIKPRKVAAVKDAFLYNVRILMNQAESLRKAREEAANHVIDSVEASCTLGMCSHTVQSTVRTQVNLLMLSHTWESSTLSESSSQPVSSLPFTTPNSTHCSYRSHSIWNKSGPVTYSTTL